MFHGLLLVVVATTARVPTALVQALVLLAGGGVGVRLVAAWVAAWVRLLPVVAAFVNIVVGAVGIRGARGSTWTGREGVGLVWARTVSQLNYGNARNTGKPPK